MKVNLYLITYQGEEKKEILFSDLPEDEKKRIGAHLTEKFMEGAGFSPVPV